MAKERCIFVDVWSDTIDGFRSIRGAIKMARKLAVREGAPAKVIVSTLHDKQTVFRCGRQFLIGTPQLRWYRE